jgi:Na+/proline symporter
MVTFATWFGSETMMGAPAEFIENGILGVIEEPFGATLCLILVGLFYAKIFYNLNILTFCDYFKLRYGVAAEYVSAFLMVPSYFGWIAAQLIAMGTVLEVVVGWPLYMGILISALLVMVYTLMGGMWSVSVTDFFHNILLIIGLIILTAIMLDKTGGFQPVIASTPQDFLGSPQTIYLTRISVLSDSLDYSWIRLYSTTRYFSKSYGLQRCQDGCSLLGYSRFSLFVCGYVTLVYCLNGKIPSS